VGWSDVGNRFYYATVSSLTNHEAFTVIDEIISCTYFLELIVYFSSVTITRVRGHQA